MKKTVYMDRIDRRTTLKLIGAAAPFAVLASSQAAHAGKMSQQLAHYQNKPKNGKECGRCKFFERPHSCSVVTGNISPKGWCMLWAK